MVDQLRQLPEWTKYVIAAVATSALWIGMGEVQAITAISGKRLDAIEVRLGVVGDRIVALSDKVVLISGEGALLNVRQNEQLTSLERRMADTERGREANRDGIALIIARLAGYESRVSEVDKMLGESREQHRNTYRSPGPP